jgi:hypothetical protein
MCILLRYLLSPVIGENIILTNCSKGQASACLRIIWLPILKLSHQLHDIHIEHCTYAWNISNGCSVAKIICSHISEITRSISFSVPFLYNTHSLVSFRLHFGLLQWVRASISFHAFVAICHWTSTKPLYTSVNIITMANKILITTIEDVKILS